MYVEGFIINWWMITVKNLNKQKQAVKHNMNVNTRTNNEFLPFVHLELFETIYWVIELNVPMLIPTHLKLMLYLVYSNTFNQE